MEMDPGKRQALIHWTNAIINDESCTITCLDPRQLSKSIAKLLSILGLRDEGTGREDVLAFYETTKRILQELYDPTIQVESVINVEAILKGNDLEASKMLLLLLCAGTKGDTITEQFIVPATQLDPVLQADIMSLIKEIVFQSDVSQPVSIDLSNLLCTKTVMDMKDSPHIRNMRTMSTSSLSSLVSPMRGCCLTNSPATPLAALMQSPQITQRMLIRETELRRKYELLLNQKEQELKKMEQALHNERHLRTDLEYDIREKGLELEQKECKIHDLQQQIQQLHKLQDDLDEMTDIRRQNEEYEAQLLRAHTRLNELSDMRAKCSYLEKENKDLYKQIQSCEEERQTIDTLKRDNEKYWSQVHQYEIKMDELSLRLQHRMDEVQKLKESQESMEDQLQQSRALYKQQKRDYEQEIVRNANNMMGESMAIVTEKRVGELQAELDELKKDWIDPSAHNQLKKDLQDTQDSREIFQANYRESQKKLLILGDDVEQLKQLASRFDSDRSDLQQANADCLLRISAMQADIDGLSQREKGLLQSEGLLRGEKTDLEGRHEHLERDLARVQTELLLSNNHIEAQILAEDNRRMTYTHSADIERKQLTKQIEDERSSWQDQIQQMKNKMKALKEDADKKQDEVAKKLSASHSSRKQLEIQLDNERWTKESMLTAMKEEYRALETRKQQHTDVLEHELEEEKETNAKLETRMRKEKSDHETEMDSTRQELLAAKDELKEELTERLNNVVFEKDSLEAELYRTKVTTESVQQDWSTKYQELEARTNEQVDALKADLKARKQCLSEVQEHCGKLEADVKEKVALLKESDARHAHKVEELAKQTKQHEATKRDLETTKKSLSDEIDQLNARLTQREMINENLQWELKSIQEKRLLEIQQHESVIKEKMDAIHYLQEMNNRTCAELKELETVRDGLQSCCETKENEIITLRQSIESEANKFAAEKTRLVGEIETETEKHLETMKELKSDWQARVSKLHENLKLANEDASVREMSLQKKLSKTESSLEELNHHSKEVTATLSNKLQQTESALKNAHLESMAAASRQDEVTKELQEQLAMVKENSINVEVTMKEEMACFRNEKEAAIEAGKRRIEQLCLESKMRESDLAASIEKMHEELEEKRKTEEAAKEQIAKDAKQHEETLLEIKDSLQIDREQLVENYEKRLDSNYTELRRTNALVEDMNGEQVKLAQTIDTLKQRVEEEGEKLTEHEKSTDAQIQQMKLEYENRLQETQSMVTDNAASFEEKMYRVEMACEERLDSQNQVHEARIAENNAQYEAMEAIQNLEFEKRLSILERSNDEQLIEQSSSFSTRISTLQQELNQQQLDMDCKLKTFQEEKEEEIKANEMNSIEKLEKLQACILDKENSFEEKLLNMSRKNEESLSNIQSLKMDYEDNIEKLKEHHAKELSDIQDKLRVKSDFYESELSAIKASYVEAGDNYTNVVNVLKQEHEHQISKLESCILKSEKQQDKLLSVNAEIQSRFSLEMGKVDKLQANNEKLLQELEHSQTLFSELASQNSELQSESASLAESTEQMTGNISQLDAHIIQLQSDVSTLTQSKEQSESMNSEKSAIIFQLQSEYASLNENRTKMLSEISEQSAFISKLQTDISSLTDLKTLSDSQTVAQTAIVTRLQAEKSDMEQKFVSLSEENKTSLDRMQTTHQAEMERERRSKDHLNQEMAKMQTEFSEAENIIAALKYAVEEQSAKFEHERVALEQKLETTAKSGAHDNEMVSLQLSSLQQRYEVSQRTIEHLEKQAAMYDQQRASSDNKARELKSQVTQLRETERRLINEHKRDVSTAAELNAKQSKKLQECDDELRKHRERSLHEVTKWQSLVEQAKQTGHMQLAELKEAKVKSENELLDKLNQMKAQRDTSNSANVELQEKYEQIVTQRSKMQEIADKYKQHYDHKKEQMQKVTQELEAERKKSDTTINRLHQSEAEMAPVKAKLAEGENNRKSLIQQVLSLEAQVQHSNQQLREYQNQSFMGHATTRPQTGPAYSLRKRTNDVSMLDHTLNDSLEEDKSTRCEDSYTSLESMPNISIQFREGKGDKIKNITLISTVSTPTGKTSSKITSGGLPISIKSKLCDITGSTPSIASIQNQSMDSRMPSVPRGTGHMFSCEDEPPDFEWSRLNELQRRNTLCLPHLKTSYPVETQQCTSKNFSDDKLQKSQYASSSNFLTDSGRKRKNSSKADMENRPDGDVKQARMTAYRKPGPPTPVYGKPGRGTPKIEKSPKTPGSGRRKFRNNKNKTPKRGNGETTPTPSKKKKDNNIAFNIGFTPKASRRLTRQTATAIINKGTPQKEPSTKVTKKSFGLRNFLQKGH